MLLINTRPADRSQALSQRLQAAGYRVLELPLLELAACPYSSQLQQLYQRLPQAQIIVVVSPTAVEIGMEYLEQSAIDLPQLQQVQWVAVGQTTAEALSHYGVHSWVPELETSEGMLKLSIFEQRSDLSTVAFWRGEGGRQFMMQSLQSRAIEVLNFVLYQRFCPQLSHQRFIEMAPQLEQESGPVVVTISSEASWLNWLMLGQASPQLVSQCHYLVLGPRLYELLHAYQRDHNVHFHVLQLDSLKPDAVLDYMTALSGPL